MNLIDKLCSILEEDICTAICSRMEEMLDDLESLDDIAAELTNLLLNVYEIEVVCIPDYFGDCIKIKRIFEVPDADDDEYMIYDALNNELTFAKESNNDE